MAAFFSSLFPCPCGGETKKRLVEISSFGAPEPAPEPASALDRAKSWVASAAAPVTQYRANQEKAAAHDARAGALMKGAQMKLHPARGAPIAARVALSPDGAMLTWHCQGGSQSGVMSLNAVRDVKRVLTSGWLRSGEPVPGQWELVADDQTVRLEAATDDERAEWMEVLEKCCEAERESKAGRKTAYAAKRKKGMDERAKEAERRKAELLKSCGSAGMKHTAQAMMNRG